MNVILNIIVLIFEVLYYSLFMKNARQEGKLFKYLICFSLVTLISGILNVQALISYMLSVLAMLVLLKYIVKLKIGLYDLLFLFIMMFVKVIIETIVFLIFGNIPSMVIFYMLLEFTKIAFILIFKDKINKIYYSLKEKWNKNNFYIRYIFTIFMFTYCIVSCVFIILYYM